MKHYSVLFSPYAGVRKYTYKTTLELQPKDFAVVETPGGNHQVVKIVEEVAPPVFECKHIVQVVNFDHYKAALANDKADKQAKAERL